jgi:hypothetical protein
MGCDVTLHFVLVANVHLLQTMLDSNQERIVNTLIIERSSKLAPFEERLFVVVAGILPGGKTARQQPGSFRMCSEETGAVDQLIAPTAPKCYSNRGEKSNPARPTFHPISRPFTPFQPSNRKKYHELPD